MILEFTKLHGLGNDFVLIDDLRRHPKTPLTAALAIQLCDRRLGVGADQILWMLPAQDPSADARMEIFNSNGTVAEMCGNGIRAAGLYLSRHGVRPGLSRYKFETLAGLKSIEIAENLEIRVDMGPPLLGARNQEIAIHGQSLKFTEVSMGNPHAVFFTDSVDLIELERLGPLIENHPRFTDRTNVEFVQAMGPNQIRVRVWERGAGITLACGTGACASVVAAVALGHAQSAQWIEVALPGGTLRVKWAGEGAPVEMAGPAVEVYRGQFLVIE